HRVTPYGVLANLLAMSIVSAWVMPMGILGILTMPFGLDAEFWRQMGYGIEWMNAVGLWVASLPGGHGRFSGHRPVENGFDRARRDRRHRQRAIRARQNCRRCGGWQAGRHCREPRSRVRRRRSARPGAPWTRPRSQRPPLPPTRSSAAG